IKLIDFGLAKSSKIDDAFYCGTQGFLAPEYVFFYQKLPADLREAMPLYSFRTFTIEILKACEVWSFAVTLYDLLYHRLPFGHTIEEEYSCFVEYIFNQEIESILDQHLLTEEPARVDIDQSLEHVSIRTDDYEQQVIYQLLKDSFEIDYTKRPTASQLLSCIK